MYFRTHLALLFLVICIAGSSAHAGNKTVPEVLRGYELYGDFIYFPSTPELIYLLGEITENQDIHLRRALSRFPIDSVVLSSPGGNVLSGLALAGVINDRGLSTYIPSGAVCASACSYLFLAGESRISSGRGRLGVHQFAPAKSSKVDSRSAFQTAQEVMGYIYSVVDSFGVPSWVVGRMLETPPNDMYYFNGSQMADIQRGSASKKSSEAERVYSEYLALLSQAESGSGVTENKVPESAPTPPETQKPKKLPEDKPETPKISPRTPEPQPSKNRSKNAFGVPTSGKWVFTHNCTPQASQQTGFMNVVWERYIEGPAAEYDRNLSTASLYDLNGSLVYSGKLYESQNLESWIYLPSNNGTNTIHSKGEFSTDKNWIRYTSSRCELNVYRVLAEK